MADRPFEHHVRQYREQGFCFPLPLLSLREVEANLDALKTVASRCNVPMRRLPRVHEYFQWAYDLAAHPALLDLVEEILGPNVVIWGTLVLSKAPSSRFMVPWHQDSAYAPFLQGSPSVSAWIALTPATVENGCMRVIPGSQGHTLPFSDKQEADDMLKRGQRVLAEIDDSQAVNIELHPGQASLHDVTLVHGSRANCSHEPRTGFVIRYATPAVLPQIPVFCVRGRAGNLPCFPETLHQDEENGYRLYAEFLRTHGSVETSADQG